MIAPGCTLGTSRRASSTASFAPPKTRRSATTSCPRRAFSRCVCVCERERERESERERERGPRRAFSRCVRVCVCERERERQRQRQRQRQKQKQKQKQREGGREGDCYWCYRRRLRRSRCHRRRYLCLHYYQRQQHHQEHAFGAGTLYQMRGGISFSVNMD